MENENIKKNLTCYERHDQEGTQCEKMICNHWVDSKKCINSDVNKSNCAIICSKHKKLTFDEIGKMFDLTRMRICQIEKNALNKMRYSIIRQTSLLKNSLKK